MKRLLKQNREHVAPTKPSRLAAASQWAGRMDVYDTPPPTVPARDEGVLRELHGGKGLGSKPSPPGGPAKSWAILGSGHFMCATATPWYLP